MYCVQSTIHYLYICIYVMYTITVYVHLFMYSDVLCILKCIYYVYIIYVCWGLADTRDMLDAAPVRLIDSESEPLISV